MSAAAAILAAPVRAHHLTMSKMALAHDCAYGFRPEVPQTESKSGPEAVVGTIAHALAEAHIKGRSHAFLETFEPELVTKALAIFNGPLKAFLDSRKWTACEIGLEYDAADDRAAPCPRRGEHGYGDVAPMRLRGTLDLVTVDGDSATVIDLKTGKFVGNAEQLYAQAVAVSRHYGVSQVSVGYLYARKTKCDPPALETLDADALDYQAGRIARLLRKLPVAEPVRGDWCWRCNARESCPAWGPPP